MGLTILYLHDNIILEYFLFLLIGVLIFILAWDSLEFKYNVRKKRRHNRLRLFCIR
jgi:hypothetical protein